MKKIARLEPGDRVAYSAKFLKNTGQFTDDAGQRRGTFVKYWGDDRVARVKWDDFEDRAPYYAKQWGQDYVDDAREHGQCVLAVNIAKVGSPRFASNDL